MESFQRSVARLNTPPVKQGMTPQHRVRELVAFSDSSETDPFLVLMEDWFPEGVFDRHPHRGMETVTYVIDGRIEHYDNHGNKGSISPGDAQWMTAGRGIIHNEQPAHGHTIHSLQLWVNLPSAVKMVDPRYQDLTASTVPVRRELGVEVRVFSGASGGVVAATRNYAPVTMLEVCLNAGASVSLDLPGDYNAFLVVLAGARNVGAANTAVRKDQVALLTRGDTAARSELRITAGDAPFKALLYAGRSIGEPVVARGPFVMSTEEEIKQAYADFRAGLFGA